MQIKRFGNSIDNGQVNARQMAELFISEMDNYHFNKDRVRIVNNDGNQDLAGVWIYFSKTGKSKGMYVQFDSMINSTFDIEVQYPNQLYSEWKSLSTRSSRKDTLDAAMEVGEYLEMNYPDPNM